MRGNKRQSPMRSEVLKKEVTLNIKEDYSETGGEAYLLSEHFMNASKDEGTLCDAKLAYVFACGVTNEQCAIFCVVPSDSSKKPIALPRMKTLGLVDKSELTEKLYEHACNQAEVVTTGSKKYERWRDVCDGRRVTKPIAGIGELVMTQTLYH